MSQYNKFIVAVVGAVITYLIHRYGGVTPWVQDIVLAATALGVYSIPNAG